MDSNAPQHGSRNAPDSLANLAYVLERNGDGIIVFDRDWRYLSVNAPAERILARPAGELLGRGHFEVFPELTRTRRYPLLLRAMAGEEFYYEIRSYNPDAWYEVRCLPVEEGLICVFHNITDRKRAEEAERQRQQYFERITASIPDYLYVWQVEPLEIVYANRPIGSVLGYPPEAYGDGEIAFLNRVVHPDDFAVIRESRRWLATAADGEVRETAFRMHDAEGNWRTFRLRQTVFERDAAGAATQVIGTCRDITVHKQLLAEREALVETQERLLTEARERAERDALTGLYGHQEFHRRLKTEAQRARETGQPLSVAVLDIDNFKFFNDVFGHQEGDAVLRRVADALRNGLRVYDIASRTGGDEFALLMPGLTRSRAHRLLTRSVLRALSDGHQPAQYPMPVPIQVSLGVATLPEEAENSDFVLHLADQRLLLSKRQMDDSDTESLRESLADLFDGFPLLDALVTAVDVKDRYTRRHSEDVLNYALLIAAELGWSAERSQRLQVAALLHDVGKIGVPDRILRLPSRLSSSEFAQIRQHAPLGAALVSAVLRASATGGDIGSEEEDAGAAAVADSAGLFEIVQAVRHHHETWDGHGYPDGLSGEDIPEMARLLAVADAFSAMTTDRPYRRGLDYRDALAVLSEGAGIQWDPHFAPVFIRAYTENRAGSRSLAGSEV